ncbi:MAG: alpha-hydroxy-acid oxidizing protein, partial [Bacteriovoracia bacterium]
RGWAMGVGSQRRDFEVLRGKSAAGYHSVDHWKSFRTDFPRLTLLGNLGISQLIDASIDDVRKLVDLIEASALCVHVNAMQEAIQPEGTPHFRGALKALETLCAKLGVPVVLKETGCGFSSNTLVRLKNVGLAAIDVSGLGGTHWGRIEGSRAESGSLQQRAAVTFGNWGETTVDSVVAAKNVLGSGGAGGTEIWASGGVRSGLDAAKLIALGSKQVGYAQPVLKAALGGEAVLDSWMKQMEFELKVALFCTGSSSPTALRGKSGICSIKKNNSN